MRIIIPFTLGTALPTTPESTTPQWSYNMQGRNQRTFPGRVRNDVWVQTGDLRHSKTTLDTWEGEAT